MKIDREIIIAASLHSLALFSHKGAKKTCEGAGEKPVGFAPLHLCVKDFRRLRPFKR